MSLRNIRIGGGLATLPYTGNECFLGHVPKVCNGGSRMLSEKGTVRVGFDLTRSNIAYYYEDILIIL